MPVVTSAQRPTTGSAQSLPVDPGSSLRALTARFVQAGASGGAPELAMLTGRHQAHRVGPLWIRLLAPGFLAITGMPGWWGKEFPSVAGADAAERLEGHNLIERGGTVAPSLPMQATIRPSRVDGRPAIVATYPPTAPFPWRSVVDELRPVDTGVLLGLSFGIPLAPRGGIPFVLIRAATGSHPGP